MKVFIGVDHGGSDPGAVSHLVEKNVNWLRHWLAEIS